MGRRRAIALAGALLAATLASSGCAAGDETDAARPPGARSDVAATDADPGASTVAGRGVDGDGDRRDGDRDAGRDDGGGGDAGRDGDGGADDADGGDGPITATSVGVELVATTASATDVVFDPVDGSMLVAEHDGRVVRVGDDGSQRVVIDLTERLEGHADEQGLTGLELSADGRHAWLHLTPADGATAVVQFDVGADGRFDPASERTLLDVGGPPGSNHDAGDLLLADDGTLLITLGDGEAGIRAPGEEPIPADDPHRHADDPTSLRGSILRVRPTPDGPRPYEIPDDNPFADGPLVLDDGAEVEGAPEVLAWGLRNPWKIDLDEVTGSLWIADVGSAALEEIDVVTAEGGRPAGWAADFGWSGFEGTEVRNADVEPVALDPVEPIHVYDHADGRCAISGGVVYRGDDVEGLRGGYVFGDFCGGSIHVLDPSTGEVRELADGLPAIAAVRADPDGELVVATWFGEIHRLTAP